MTGLLQSSQRVDIPHAPVIFVNVNRRVNRIRSAYYRARTCPRYHREVVTTDNQSLLQVFRDTGAYLQGHFRLTSGLHSPEYMQCALVLQHPIHAEMLGRSLGENLRALDPARGIDVVVSPAMGGLIIGHEVARTLRCRHIFTERVEGRMTLRRGFQVRPGETAVVVEDVITTGGSSLEVVNLLKDAGVQVVGAASIVDRSGGRAELSVPRVSLLTMHIVAHNPDTCPLCAQGLPVVKPGSRSAA